MIFSGCVLEAMLSEEEQLRGGDILSHDSVFPVCVTRFVTSL